MTLLSNFKTLLLSFQAIVRPSFTPFSSSSSYPAAGFRSPEYTPLSSVLHHQLRQRISCSACSFISSPIITTSQSSRTSKDFNILYFQTVQDIVMFTQRVCPDWNTHYVNETWKVFLERWYDMYDVYKSDEDLWFTEPLNTNISVWWFWL